MSYLNATRLHFAGLFQANVSTVNNDADHFDNKTFKPEYQLMQTDTSPNGWFNPEGDAAFRLLGCRVTSAWLPSGPVPASDPVLKCLVADADDSVSAKLVDLDTEQQLVSEIWGLRVRIANAAGETLLQGDFEPAAFIDIWTRATGRGSDNGAGATYQSVLRNLQWGDVAASPFLSALRQAAGSGLLSIKFNVDGLNMDFTAADFMCGRIVGTIGPAATGEPSHLVVGRQFMAVAVQPNPGFFIPEGGINFCVAVVDTTTNHLILDLGNALSTSAPRGEFNNLGNLAVSTVDPAGTTIGLGTIPATGASGYAHNATWYGRTAGVIALPLTAAQIQSIAALPLTISGNQNISISEWSTGTFVRADRYVYRMSPGDQVTIPVYAMRFGRPLTNEAIAFSLDAGQLQPQVGTVATPDILSFDAAANTDNNGVANLIVHAGDPGTPRWFGNGSDYGIDGQVYGIRPSFGNAANITGPDNQANFISFLAWSVFTPANPVTWDDLQPILQQYANLYPVMNRFLNMGDFASVVAHAGLLKLAFGLDPANPNAMPVTRDMSPAKRKAILAWLDNPLPGTAPPAAAPQAVVATAMAVTGARPMPKGGKAAATARRLVLRTP